MLLTDAVRVGQSVVSVGDRGVILLGGADGRSWRAARSPGGPLLTAVRFLDDRRGWAVGHDSVIVATADGGENWSQQFSAPKEQRPLLDVLFLDAPRGFAVGAYGAYYETADGGATWKPRAVLQEDRHLNAIVSVGGSRLLAFGEAGTILRSDDAGGSWALVASPYQGSLFGAVVVSDAVVIAYGLRGRILRSTDAGKTWAMVDNASTATLMGGALLPDGAVALAGAAGTVLMSRDAGRSFFPVASGTSRALSKALPSPGGLLLFGEAGVRSVALPAAPR
jgi:photosystem II stability/assembly factor-like uncharacterized protein